jgi:hypothetical protein
MKPEYCNSCGERKAEYGVDRGWGKSTYCPTCEEEACASDALRELSKKPEMSEKQKALNTLTSATKLFMSAGTKKEADGRYELMRHALEKYYNTVWCNNDRKD